MPQVRAEQTRSRIIETAARAFADHGYDGVSLNDLIAATGMSKGAFYFHFASKDEVALAAFRAKQEELIEHLFGAERGSSAVAEVKEILRRRAQLVTDDVSLRCVIRLGSDLGARSGPGSEYASFQELAVAVVADLIRRGVASREFRRGLDPEGTARAVFAWVVGMDSLSLLESDGKDVVDRTEEMLGLLIPALSAAGQAGRSRQRRP